MDHTAKFDGKAEAYSSGRPSYAEKLIEWLYAEQGLSGQSRIADIGSGTGIFTAQLLQKGGTVFAVEPNADMRRKAESALSPFENFRSVNGTAEHTTLAPRSVDFITVAVIFCTFMHVIIKKRRGKAVGKKG